MKMGGVSYSRKRLPSARLTTLTSVAVESPASALLLVRVGGLDLVVSRKRGRALGFGAIAQVLIPE